MYRRMLILLFACAAAIPAVAQDLSNIQIHGFVTQGLLYSSNNNWFTTKSMNGSVQWTDGAISISDNATDKLRIGVQLHMYELGELGGPQVDVDWASGDYRVAPWLGIRAGKVKTRIGLFNDSQDVDAVHLWALLPESMYQTDNKSFYLAHFGFDVYGTLDLSKRAGKVSYTGYVGYRDLDLHGGYIDQIRALGLVFSAAPAGGVYGGDIRWQAPLNGVTVGTSAKVDTVNGAAPGGGIKGPYLFTYSLYGEYERGKFFGAAEYRRSPLVGSISSPLYPLFPFIFSEDTRAWYVMASYRVLPKLQVGAYRSVYLDKRGEILTPGPTHYSKDWTVSGRYDFNQYFYAKIEGHFVHGTALNFYPVTNPNGNKTDSKLLAAKLGFTF